MNGEREADFDLCVAPGGRLAGRLHVPGDKSISHRAVILGAIAEGETTATGLLEGEDVLATVAAFRGMGVSIEGPERGRIAINGAGLRGLRASTAPLDMGNSGTAMRLLAGVLVGQRFASSLTGDASLSRRPMSRVVEPLRQMGARIAGSAGGRPPLVIEPVAALTPIRYRLPMPSAQVKSAVLLAGLYARGATVVIEPVTTRDHTERMLMRFGCTVARRGDEIRLDGGQQPRGAHVDVPADLSSAAFFVVGASIASDSVLELEGVGVNPTRTGVLDILRAMGADIVLRNRRQQGGEPVADLVVRSARLRGARIGGRQVALAIDEFPVLAVAAACADGVTVVRDAAELRHKESDRIAAVVKGLRALGIDADEHDDGMTIHGGRPRGGVVDSCGDHRLAMAFAMAALAARDEVRVRRCRNVATSFPDFVSLARAAGLGVTREVGH